MSARPARASALAACALVAACAAPPEHGLGVSELRPTAVDASALPRFDPGEVIERETSASGAFAVHFTRRGRNAVPAGDAYVSLVAQSLDDALGRYRALGFRVPQSDARVPGDRGGDARFDAYLVDFALRADGAFRLDDGCDPTRDVTCAGHMVVENDFAGYRYVSAREAVRTVASHELFHAVQAAYRLGQGVVLEEATAVWATERFDPALDDLERLAGQYLNSPDRALDQDPAGPPDGFSYGAALFFEHLTSRHGDDVVRELWERLAEGGAPAEPWLVALDAVLRERHGSSFATEFTRFATWNLFTGPAADPSRAWPRGEGLAPVLVTRVELPYTLERVRLFRASARYYAFAPDGPLRVAVAPADEGAASALDGVNALVACRQGPRFGAVVPVTALGGTTVDVAGADECVVGLVNTRVTGGSSQLRVCAGALDAVTACLARGGDAGVTADVSAGAMTPGGGGCACAARGPSRASHALVLLALGFALARGRRRC